MADCGTAAQFDTTAIARRIIDECFHGDYSFTEKAIVDIARNGSLTEKKFLFARIVQEGSHTSYLLRIFDRNDLRELFDKYRITFNHALLEKRVFLCRAILLDDMDNSLPDRYKWK